MPTVGSIASNVLIARWRQRRREILQMLPTAALVEYRELGISIKKVRAEEAGAAQAREKKTEQLATAGKQCDHKGFFRPLKRIPLSVHRSKLFEYLRDHGPCTRNEIIAQTGIPSGSLSELLKLPGFEQKQRGFWGLKGPLVITPGESVEKEE